MVCSDGLNGEITDPQIRDIMVNNGHDMESMAKELIDAACDNGGKDNVTAICAHVEELI
jgi:PPM family protein phosphatase